MDLEAEKYAGTLDDISMKDIVKELKEKGYEIKQLVASGNTITGISLDKSSITISANGTATIKVEYEGNSDGNVYYAVIDGKYYKMTLTDSGVKVDRTASEIDETPSTETLTATSSEESNVTVESINDNVITVKAGSSVGEATIKVTYGSYTKTCDVSVVVKPTEDSVADSTVSFKTTYGRIDVIWLNGTTNQVTSTPNEPILTSNGESMTPVVWNSDNNIVETTSSDSNWYSYIAGSGTADNLSSKWANAKTANDSYFVWIPRYAYRITYYASQTSTEPTGYYDGFGMWKATDGTLKYALDSGIETVEYNGNKYIVHPAFETNLDNGGWSSDLSGFWCAKFEISGTGPSLESTYGTNSTRNQTIGTQYTSGRQATYGYAGTTDTDGNTSFMYSHMMKNSEWGAVAYLTHSQYGRNGNKITKNTTYNRGGSSGTGYLTKTKQSTTGNVYGVYDMSGNTWDRVAAFNSADSEGEFSTYGWTEATGLTVNSSSTKYATKYNNATTSSGGNAVVYLSGKVGDATKEVNGGGEYSVSSTSYYRNWFNDDGFFTISSSPFFSRGMFSGGSDMGIFTCYYYKGYKWNDCSFRTVLCP